MQTYTFLQLASTGLLASFMFILIILINRAGHLIRKWMISRNPDNAKVELGTMNGILLGLLGLLLAFTFGMANSRFDRRRELVIEEANDIGTAILRADLYPDSTRQLLRTNFKEYLEARIAHYEAKMDMKTTAHYYFMADSVSRVLWNIATTDARVNNVISRTSQMIPALNAMIDITTTRRSAGESTIPDSIMYFLFVLTLCSSFLVGYDTKGKTDRIVIIGFAMILSITLFMIIDLDRPRSGFINMDVPHQKIVELRGMFSGQ